MPTVTLNRKVFEKLVGKKLPLEKLKDRISYLGTDLESVEKDKIVVEVFPNRPDMLSEQGFARAFSSFIGLKTGLRKYRIEKSEFRLFAKNLPSEWPYVVGAVVKGVKLDDDKIMEIIQVQEKIDLTLLRNRKKGGIGFYPLEKIKFPVSFVGEKPEKIKFRPLQYPAPLTARQILAHHPTGRKYKHICEHWKKFTVFKDSKGVVMSMPPIINSHDVGKINESTRDMFVEVTGTNLEAVKISLNIVVTMLADMGGKIYSVEMIYPEKKFHTPDLTPRKMKVDFDYVNRLLDLKLPKKRVLGLLGRMGYGQEGERVLVPAYRGDVMHQIDLVEDVAIAYGYENFEPQIPNIATIGSEDEFSIFSSKIANIMVGLGFIETSTYHLTNRHNLNEKMHIDMDCVEIENSKNSEYSVLRSWVTPSLMGVLGRNTRYEYPQRLFEIGTVFKKGGKETGVEEFSRLAATICDKDVTFTDIKQAMDFLFGSLNMEYIISETDHSSFIPGRVGRISVKGKKIAYIGEIHPKVLDNFGIEQPVCAFEVNLSNLFDVLKK